jgi:small subunit ribosomal protein S9
MPCDTYFERETSRMILRQSLDIVEVVDKFDIRATVMGGGKSAQAEAIRHGIARVLSADDQEHRRVLKRAGFITRDARQKERKKPGQPGARKRFQFSKR